MQDLWDILTHTMEQAMPMVNPNPNHWNDEEVLKKTRTWLAPYFLIPAFPLLTGCRLHAAAKHSLQLLKLFLQLTDKKSAKLWHFLFFKTQKSCIMENSGKQYKPEAFLSQKSQLTPLHASVHAMVFTKPLHWCFTWADWANFALILHKFSLLLYHKVTLNVLRFYTFFS